MKLSHLPIAESLRLLGAELRPQCSLAELTSLGIGGTTDGLLIRRRKNLPEVIRLLDEGGIPHRFLGGGTNLLVADEELPWVVLQFPPPEEAIRIEDNLADVDASADLGGTVTFCARRDLGGLEGLIGVPGSVGGALRMNAGAYGTQIGPHVRQVTLFRRATGRIETLVGADISFDYRRTSFAPEDIILNAVLDLPSRPYREIVEAIRVCNEKRRASQPLRQKSAGCIFKNPPGASAGRMLDELGLKGFRVGDAMVSDRHANFFVNVGSATCTDMLALMETVRERVFRAFGVPLENEVILWRN